MNALLSLASFGRCTATLINAFTFLIVTQQSRAGADFYIVEHTDRLLVYNKYQQEATAKDRQILVPFVPMKILKANDMLGDGFTHCMQIEIGGQIFYLLKDNAAGLSRSGPLGFDKIFSNATILLDTVRILTRHSIQFSSINSSARQLSVDERVLRVFRHQNLTYCRVLSNPPQYGWIDFSGRKDGKNWIVLRNIAPADSSISSVVVQKVRTQVGEVNRVLAHLFEFFNKQTHQQKQPPQWNIESSQKAILCTLQGSSESFEQSTFYLVNDLENIVLGSAFEVAHTPGRIEIRQK